MLHRGSMGQAGGSLDDYEQLQYAAGAWQLLRRHLRLSGARQHWQRHQAKGERGERGQSTTIHGPHIMSLELFLISADRHCPRHRPAASWVEFFLIV